MLIQHSAFEALGAQMEDYSLVQNNNRIPSSTFVTFFRAPRSFPLVPAHVTLNLKL